MSSTVPAASTSLGTVQVLVATAVIGAILCHQPSWFAGALPIRCRAAVVGTLTTGTAKRVVLLLLGSCDGKATHHLLHVTSMLPAMATFIARCLNILAAFPQAWMPQVAQAGRSTMTGLKRFSCRGRAAQQYCCSCLLYKYLARHVGHSRAQLALSLSREAAT
jgi:hypothetical protein